MRRFPVPTKPVKGKYCDVICAEHSHRVVLRSGHRPICEQERQLGRSPTQQHRRFH
jgi:hypothetical protein